MGRPKVYVDSNGLRLRVGRSLLGFFVYWGDKDTEANAFDAIWGWPWLKDMTPTCTDAWELLTVAKVISKRSAKDGLFLTRSAALGAIEEANAVLLEGKGKPWPGWAIEAKKAGWKAPKGWKP